MKHAIIIWLWVSVCNSYCLVGVLVRVKGICWCLVGGSLGGCWSGFWGNLCFGVLPCEADFVVLDSFKEGILFSK